MVTTSIQHKVIEMDKPTLGSRSGVSSRVQIRHGRPIVGSNTTLQKSNTQLRGKRMTNPETKNEDDIGAYLNSLSRKTKEQKWDESDIDISLTSDDKDAQTAPTSKFLKKKKKPTENQNPSKFTKASTLTVMSGASTISSKSSVLNKAASFVSKFSERPKKSIVEFSDSDLDLDISMDSEVLAWTRKGPQTSKDESVIKHEPNHLQPKTKHMLPKSASKADPSSLDDESISIGMYGGKFTKSDNMLQNSEFSDCSGSERFVKGSSKFLKTKQKQTPVLTQKMEKFSSNKNDLKSRADSKSAKITNSPNLDNKRLAIGIDESKFIKSDNVLENYDKNDSSVSEPLGRGGSKLLKKSPQKENVSPQQQKYFDHNKPLNVQGKHNTSSLDDESISIGINGSKFIKSNKVSEDYDNSEYSDSNAIGKGGSRFLKKKPKPSSPIPDTTEINTPGKPSQMRPVSRNVSGIGQESSKFKQQNNVSMKNKSPFLLKSADKYSTKFQLDTDEESLADFIGGLSSSTNDVGSIYTPRTPHTPRSPASMRHSITSKFISPKQSPEPIIKTIHEVNDEHSIQTEPDTDSTESFKLNVFDFGDLKMVGERESTKSNTRSPRTTNRESQKIQAVKKQKKRDTKSGGLDIFASMGIHSVDELFGQKDSDLEEVSDVEIVSESQSEIESVHSPTSRHVQKHIHQPKTKIGHGQLNSPSPDPISTARGITSRIYTDDFEDGADFSETSTSVPVSSTSQIESVHTLPTVDRSKSDDNSYSDEFTGSSVRSAGQYSNSYSQTASHWQSDSSSSYTEKYTSRSNRTERPMKHKSKRTKNISVQTTEVPGLMYSWGVNNAGFAGVTPSYGLHKVDPTPIATHVVKADALEALTSYNPCVFVLNDLLREQLQLTEFFISGQRRMHQAYIDASVPNYEYTTLQATKKYIAKHRKPKLTFDEALRQVNEEMGLT